MAGYITPYFHQMVALGIRGHINLLSWVVCHLLIVKKGASFLNYILRVICFENQRLLTSLFCQQKLLRAILSEWRSFKPRDSVFYCDRIRDNGSLLNYTGCRIDSEVFVIESCSLLAINNKDTIFLNPQPTIRTLKFRKWRGLRNCSASADCITCPGSNPKRSFFFFFYFLAKWGYPLYLGIHIYV